MKRKRELREFKWIEDKGEEKEEWEVNIMRVSVKGEERAQVSERQKRGGGRRTVQICGSKSE